MDTSRNKPSIRERQENSETTPKTIYLMIESVMTTIENKLQAIYDTISDKTLSFWCFTIDDWIQKRVSKIFSVSIETAKNVKQCEDRGEKAYIEHAWRSGNMTKDYLDEIIGHPITIGRCIDWLSDMKLSTDYYVWQTTYSEELIRRRAKMRTATPLPLLWETISDERIPVIDLLYDLLPNE